ncbi:MAG: hypothetical protein A3F40_03230 [Chlamydiae bacterium RIFCSPHIGHO2_12_FULL_27_8]|nr:MAG: hypothetical protein A3F40_03230 [Chlamydiae bacterium RIFCSPHIGHO2_12_FULL_27_8]
MSGFTKLKSFLKLKELSNNLFDLTNEKNFNSKRINDMCLKAEDFKLNFAATNIDEKVLTELNNLAKETDCLNKMQKMQDGEIVNFINGIENENNRVLHTATRDFYFEKNKKSENFSKENYREFLKLKKFVFDVDKKYENIVQIGIGGSFLGPKAIFESLKKHKKKNGYFISNVDPNDYFEVLKDLDLSKTLFISVSKSGSTLETLTNETIIREILKTKNLNPKDHIASVTMKHSKMDKKKHDYLEIFYILDNVGGRFSTTSMAGAVFLSLVFGTDNFESFLKGASKMDKLVLNDFKTNLPLLAALIGIWHINFLNYNTLAIVPYANDLKYFPSHITQLDMESNGKSLTKDNNRVDYKTGPIIFGDIGTNVQHSFFQSVHQGQNIIPVEFIYFLNFDKIIDKKDNGSTSSEKLLSNLIGQSIALANGFKNPNLNKNFNGNRPNTILIIKDLSFYNMGSLLSFYEHKIAFQGFIWNINSFDQEGVELGKKLSNQMLDFFIENKKYQLGESYLKSFTD